MKDYESMWNKMYMYIEDKYYKYKNRLSISYNDSDQMQLYRYAKLRDTMRDIEKEAGE